MLDAGRKPKPAKKQKKKKDPNEPQKPVSAYALFFRDTQAAIKGQNPNATFGEVSKIVASMWDSLGEEQKQVGMAGRARGRGNRSWWGGMRAGLGLAADLVLPPPRFTSGRQRRPRRST